MSKPAAALVCLSVAACAGHPVASAPVPGNSAALLTPPAPHAVDARAVDRQTADKALLMKRLGYTVVQRNGQTYYCHREVQTGSRILADEVCLTEKEAADRSEANQRAFRDLLKPTATPSRPAH
jgi:hypothetical protein